MKLREGPYRNSRGWQYKEMYLELEEVVEQLSFFKDGGKFSVSDKIAEGEAKEQLTLSVNV